MPAPADAPGPGARASRRTLLRAALALPLGATGLAGCTSGPAPLGGATVPPGATSTGLGAPSPAPGPAPTVPAAAAAEQRLSAYAAAVLAGPHRADLDRPARTLLGFLRDAHARHATALAGDDPTSRPTSAAPSPTAAPPALGKASLKASLAALARTESAQATAQHRAAVAGTGLDALLAGSLSVAAQSYAAALGAARPPAVAAIGPTRPAPVLSDVAAAQAVVTQLHAVVYGYQVALGRLSVGSGARTRAYAGLAAARALLDELVATLDRRHAEVPAAEPAYVPAPDPRTAAQAGALVRALETRLQPYAGILLAAAATEADRSRALAVLSRTTATARSWGAPLRAWPGWPD